MMHYSANILWIYNRPLDAEAGGTERMTSIQMEVLTRLGHHCVGMLVISDHAHELTFCGERVDHLNRFLEEKRVDVVINQMGNEAWLLDVFLQKGGKEWKAKGGVLISCLHFDPRPIPLHFMFGIIPHKTWRQWLTWVKLRILSPYYKWQSEERAGDTFRYIYHHSDAFIVLSETHFPFLRKMLRLPCCEKLHAINNPLTFADILPPAGLEGKKNVALVVARLSEYHKRISLVLKVWKLLEEKGLTRQWVLKIVGEGSDRSMYASLVGKYRLQNVFFEGKQNAEPYYREAKIYMMTSSAEGWGLALTESLQRGVVPVAMDSSPVFHEIIADGVDGYIVPNNDVSAFAQKVELLMRDQQQWQRMAVEALHHAESFTLPRMEQRWKTVLDGCLKCDNKKWQQNINN